MTASTISNRSLRPVLDRAAVAIRPLVAVVLEELVDQLTVVAHHLDAVEARTLGVDGGGAELLDDGGDLLRPERPMGRGLHEAVRRRDDNCRVRAIRQIDGSRHRLLSRNRDVRRAAAVKDLGEHVAALGMDRIRDAFPTHHLLVVVEARHPPAAAHRRRDRCRFGDDQPAVGGTLAVVLDVQVARHATRPVRSESTQRRHHDAVLELDRPELDRREECRVVFHGRGSCDKCVICK